MEQENNGVLQTDCKLTRSVFISKSPISYPITKEYEVGTTLKQILEDDSSLSENHTYFQVNGQWVYDDQYEIKPFDLVNVIQMPKEPATIAIASIVISVISAVAAYTMFEPPEGPGEQEKVKRIEGPRNESRKYDPIPVILGERNVVPAYAAEPYTEFVGNDEYVSMLFCVGQGPLNISDFKIGDTPIDQYDVEYAYVDFYNNKNFDEILKVWDQGVSQEQVDVELSARQSLTRTTVAGSNSVELDFTWPQGLRTISYHRMDGIQIEYRFDNKWYTVVKPITSGGTVSKSVYRDGNRFYLIGGHRNASYKGVNVDFYINNQTEITQHVINYDSSQNLAIIDSEGLFNNYENYTYDNNLPDHDKKISTVRVWDKTRSQFVESFQFRPVNPFTLELIDDPVDIRVTKSLDEEIHGGSAVKRADWLSIKSRTKYTKQDFLESIGIKDQNPNLNSVVFALKAKATDQLNGIIDNFNCYAQSVVPSNWDADWSEVSIEDEFVPTKNPADLYRWVLQGFPNKVRSSNNKIDIDSITEWKNRCVNEGWETSELVNYEETLKKVLNNVAFTGRAEFTMRDGKFSIVEKKEKTIPKQIFTPKNSKDFVSKREFKEKTDGIKFKFQNKDQQDQVDEGTYFDPELNLNPNDPPPTGVFETVEFWGVTNPDLAYKHARFHFLEQKLRREVYELTTDIEGLAVSRGDLVRIAHDVIDVGVGQGFITEDVNNSQIFFLDEQKNLSLGDTYYFQVRSHDNGIIFSEFSAQYKGEKEWLAEKPINVNKGDLAVYGEKGKESLDAIVMTIDHDNDFEVKLTLANAANEIYSISEDEPIPEYQTNLTPRFDFRSPATPFIKSSDSGYAYDKGVLRVFIDPNRNDLNKAKADSFTFQYKTLDENEPPDSEQSDVNIENEENGAVWKNAGVVSASQSFIEIPVEVESGSIYIIRAKANTQNGKSSPWSDQVEILISTDPALDVQNIEIEELVDTPKTPNANVSTIIVKVVPPDDESYAYSILNYRVYGRDQWFTLGKFGTQEGDIATVEVPSDGTEYEFQAVSANVFGDVNEYGLRDTIKTTNIENPDVGDPDPSDIIKVPNVKGLEIYEQGNNNRFTGRDVKFSWRKSSIDDWIELGEEGKLGASSLKLDQFFKDYEVEIWANNKRVRKEWIVDNVFTYSYEQNHEDYEREEGVPGVYREFQIRVYERGRNNQISKKAARLNVENPPAQLPDNLVLNAGYSVIEVSYEKPADSRDWDGVDVWVETTSGFNPENTEIYDSFDSDSFVISGLQQNQQYFVRIRPFDTFGRIGSPISSEFNIETLNGQDLNGLSGWAYEVDPISRQFINDNIEGGAIDLDDDIVGGQLGSNKLKNLAVDASKLADSSVESTKIANLAVGTSAIDTAAITNAKIDNLAVDETKIQDASIVEAKIGDLQVSDAKIIDLTATKITTGTVNATETITTEGIIRAVDDINNIDIQTSIGPFSDPRVNQNKTWFLSAFKNLQTTPILAFGIDELGNAFFSGDIENNNTTIDSDGNIITPNLEINSDGDLSSNGGFSFGSDSDYVEYNSSTGLEIKTSTLIIDNSEFSLDSDGKATFSGQLNATGNVQLTGENLWADTTVRVGGEEADSDYVLIDVDNGGNGVVETYKKFDGQYRQFKSLTRTEAGVANSGDIVELPGFWSSKPRIQVSPNTIPTFDSSYVEQNQTWSCRAENLQETTPGKWQFKAISDLVLGSASGTKSVNDTYNGSSNSYTSSPVQTEANTTNINVNVDLKSVRGTGTNPNYYYRTVSWRIGYASSYSGSYSWTSYKSVNLGSTLNSVNDSRSLNLPSSGTWYIKIEYSASNAGGTFSVGSTEYEYATDNVSNGDTVSGETGQISDDLVTEFIYLNTSYSTPSGWSIYKVDYSWEYAYYIYLYNNASGSFYAGGNGVYRNSSSYDGSSYYGDENLNNWQSYSYTENTNSFEGTLQGELRANASSQSDSSSVKGALRNANHTIYRRKPVPNSTTPDNEFKFNYFDYDLSSAQIITSGVLNWLAVGD